MNRAAALVKALAALSVLVALLGGVPWALLDWVGSPLSELSGEGAGQDLTTTLLSDTGLVALMGLALWLAWALLVLSVLAEVVAQARGLDRSRVSFGGPIQKLASFLVGSILFGLASPAMASATPALPSQSLPAIESGATSYEAEFFQPTSLTQEVGGPQAGDETVSSGDQETITVGRSDTAWTLAEQYLGDGTRWRDIWELNNDVEQADGSSWASPEDPVQPGWRLVLPADADTGEPPVMADPVSSPGDTGEPGGGGQDDAGQAGQTGSGAEEGGGSAGAPGAVTVESGDHFWGLAEQQLTEAWGRVPTDAEIAPYWQQMVDGNLDQLLPPEDPDLIYPDQVFAAPGVPADPTAPAAPDGGGGGAADNRTEVEDPGPADDSGAGIDDSDSTSGGGAGTGSGAGDGAGSDGTGPADDADTDDAGTETDDAGGADGSDRAGESDGSEDAGSDDPSGDTGTGDPGVDQEPQTAGVTWDEILPEGLEERLPSGWETLVVDVDAPGWDTMNPAEADAMDELEDVLMSLDETTRDELIEDDGPTSDAGENSAEDDAAPEEPADPDDTEESAEQPGVTDDDDQSGSAGGPEDDASSSAPNPTTLPPLADEDDLTTLPQAPADPTGEAADDGAVDDGSSRVDEAPVDDGTGRVDEGSGPTGGGPADPDDLPEAEMDVGPAPMPGSTDPTTPVPTPEGEGDSEVDGSSTSSIREEESGNRSLAPIGLVGGGLGLAGVLLLLDRRRRAQQRHRRKGHDIQLPDEGQESRERELRHGADPDGAELLDVALRAAAAGAGSTGLPPVRWVEADDDEVALMMESPAPPPPGFRSISADRWTTTATAAELYLMGNSASPPLPSLIPVAATSEGREVLVDLEASGVVVLDGDPSDVEGLLRATAAAAATVPWSEQTRVLLVAMDGQLTELPWVEAVPDLEQAVAEAEAHAERTARSLRALDCTTTAQARASGVMPDQWDPLIVLSALEPEDPGLVERLGALAHRSHRAVGVVVPSMAGDLPGRRLTIRDDGSLAIEGSDVVAWPRRLDPGDATDLVGLLSTAGRLADVARGEDDPVGPGVRRPVSDGDRQRDEARFVEDFDEFDEEDRADRDDDLNFGVDAQPVMEEIKLDPLDSLLDDFPVDGPGENGFPELDVLGSRNDEDGAVHHEAALTRSSGDPDAGATDGEGAALVPSSASGGGAGPGELTPADDLGALLGDVDVLIRVLGEVEAVHLDHGSLAVSALGTPEPAESKLTPTRQKGLEAVTYLALREAAVDRQDLESALFPEGVGPAKTVHSTISSARALVGDDLFPVTEGGRYELSERVVTDYGLFCELVAQADETEDPARAADRLAGALSLVRGEPFVGVGRGYAWVGAHRGMIVAQVVDAADELAEIRLALGDWRAAEWAARQALRAFPADERMYRLLMRTARAAGNMPGVQRAFRELCDVIADPAVGVEPEDTLHPETVALFEELTGGSAKASGRAS